MTWLHASSLWLDCCYSLLPPLPPPGEKLTDEEVDALLSGVEDSQGQVNYEGTYKSLTASFVQLVSFLFLCLLSDTVCVHSNQNNPHMFTYMSP